MKWSDLQPEPAIVAALDYAGPRPENSGQNEKRHWSELFANGCAVAIAMQMRESSVKNKKILPVTLDGGTNR